MEISFNSIVPILRIFDIAKADEFHQGFLGFGRLGSPLRSRCSILPSNLARQFDPASKRASWRRLPRPPDSGNDARRREVSPLLMMWPDGRGAAAIRVASSISGKNPRLGYRA